MSNVIYILLHAGWNPRSPNLWMSDANTERPTIAWKASPDLVASAITRFFLSRDPARADNHYNGTGVKDDFAVDSTLSHIGISSDVTN